MDTHRILVAIIGGIIPIFIWVMFFLREDSDHPEPTKRILEVLIGGMICTYIAYLGQELFVFFRDNTVITSLSILDIGAFASIEEIVKFAVCYFIALRSADDDEPIDAVIYMVVTALGFASLENFYYLLDPHFAQNAINAYTSGAMRFIGASLLHLLTASIVGIFIAFSFNKNGLHKKISLIFGLFFAIIVHTLFNIFVSENALTVFALVWFGIILVIVILEKIKLLPLNSDLNKFGTS